MANKDKMFTSMSLAKTLPIRSYAEKTGLWINILKP